MKHPLKKIVETSNAIIDRAQERLKREVQALVRSGVISTRESRQLLKAAAREADRERKRFQAFVAAELKRELAKAKPKIKKALAHKRKQFESYRKLRRK